ncbi:MAG: hypothetical protein ACOYL6_14465 [Bacteriovoracaceae bacterium]
MSNHFLIPFTERKSSGPSKTNFLWKLENLYVMDNHRLAAWCWAQEIPSADHTLQHLLHMDAHYDCDPRALKEWIESGRVLKNLTIKDYLDLKNSEGQPMILWDNYLPIFFHDYQKMLGKKVAVTHRMGIKGEFDLELETFDFLKPIDDLLLFQKPWIVNVDIDYFFPRHDKEHTFIHPETIRKFFRLLKLNYDEGHISVLTVCLSPECCGGWTQAESVLKIFEEEFKLPNILPPL